MQTFIRTQNREKITREKLGELIETSGPVIQMYEREERNPSVEIARRLAVVLEVSLDYLVGNTDLKMEAFVLETIQEIQQLPEKDRDYLFYLLKNVLQNVKARQAFS